MLKIMTPDWGPQWGELTGMISFRTLSSVLQLSLNFQNRCCLFIFYFNLWHFTMSLTLTGIRHLHCVSLTEVKAWQRGYIYIHWMLESQCILSVRLLTQNIYQPLCECNNHDCLLILGPHLTNQSYNLRMSFRHCHSDS